MTTPKRKSAYYRVNDHINENKAAQALEKRYGCKSHKMSIAYGLDFALVDADTEEVKAFAEVKSRERQSHEFSTYVIAVQKVLKARALARATGKPVMLCVQWMDKTGVISFNKKPVKITWAGRKDRNDECDMEPMAHFLVSDFTMFEET